MSADSPLRVNNCIKPDIAQPESGGTRRPESFSSLSIILSEERKADRGSRGLRRGKGSRRPRCSRCSGRHNSVGSQCEGGTLGLNQLVKIASKITI